MADYLWESWIFCAKTLGFLTSTQIDQISQSDQQDLSSLFSEQQCLTIRLMGYLEPKTPC